MNKNCFKSFRNQDLDKFFKKKNFGKCWKTDEYSIALGVQLPHQFYTFFYKQFGSFFLCNSEAHLFMETLFLIKPKGNSSLIMNIYAGKVVRQNL